MSFSRTCCALRNFVVTLSHQRNHGVAPLAFNKFGSSGLPPVLHAQIRGGGTTTSRNGKKIDIKASKGNQNVQSDDEKWIESLSVEKGDLEASSQEVVIENDEWGQKAYDAAIRVLYNTPDIELYSFRALKSKRLDIRLDKLSGLCLY